jgi:hypothetical protein
VTVTGAPVSSPSSPAPFTLGRVSVSRHGGKPATVAFPVTLHKGDVLHAAVKFAPAAAGGAEGAVSFTTSTGSSPPVSVPLIGDGTSTGLFATAPSLSFVIVEDSGLTANVPVGLTKSLVTDIVNGGTKPVTVTSVKLPSRRYRTVHLPKVGTIIKPGEALPVEVIFSPQHAVTSNSSLTFTASSGTRVTVTLTGTGLPPVSRFTASPSTVNFGAVRVGHTATVVIHLRNAGNQPSLMRSSAPTSGPFGAPVRVTNGLPVNGEDDLVLPVTFHPTRAGVFSGVYKVTWTDPFGRHTLGVPITGTGV